MGIILKTNVLFAYGKDHLSFSETRRYILLYRIYNLEISWLNNKKSHYYQYLTIENFIVLSHYFGLLLGYKVQMQNPIDMYRANMSFKNLSGL